MEKLKSKSPYIFIAMASISFIIFYLRKRIRLRVMSDERKAKMIQDVINEVRQEQKNKDLISEMIKQGRDERTSQIMAFSKYGHKHK